MTESLETTCGVMTKDLNILEHHPSIHQPTVKPFKVKGQNAPKWWECGVSLYNSLYLVECFKILMINSNF